MKTSRFISISAALVSIPVYLVSAGESPLRNTAYQASVEQEQLRAQTKRLMVDMNAMLEEFRRNPAAAEEVALTQDTIEKLAKLSDKDMAAVVLSMREASSGQAPQKFLSASKEAKEIQVALSLLADKLALYQDEASVELRLIGLIRRQLANQRQARYLSDGTVQGAEIENATALSAAEQKAIATEIGSLLQAVGKLAVNPAGKDVTVFRAVNAASATSQIAPASQLALSTPAGPNAPAAVEAQGRVVGGLQDMLLALNAGKPLDERLRTAEQRMRSLATREQALARNTTKAGLPQRRVVIQRQQEVADQRTLVEREVVFLSAGTAPLLGQTRQSLDTLDGTLQKSPQVMDRPDEKLGIVNTQNEVAANFLAIAEMLKKQADAVASAKSSGQGNSDPARSALSTATSSVLEAISKMDMAQQILNQKGDTGAAVEQMSKAGADLAKAQEQLGQSGSSAPEGAGENLQKSQQGLGQSKDVASQGGGDSQAKANAGVGEAKELATKALEGMQKALNAMNGESRMLADNQSQGTPGQPSQGSGSGGGWSDIFHHGNDFTAFSALAKISEKDREALSTLQREKSPPEYDTQARQYLKNLADGVVPVQ